MSDNARFHNKLHRKNHHTLPTVGYPDSGIDPIASPSEPFEGDFYLTGSLSAQDNVYVGDKLGVRTSNPNYEVSINGGLSATQDVIVDNNLLVRNNGTITNNLSSLGNTVLGTNQNNDITINAGPIKMPNAINAVEAIIMGGDTNLYRGAADTLQTDDSLFVRANTTLGDENTDQTTIRGIVRIADSSATNGILFGSGNANYDTNLYRSAPDTLRTDDNFIVAGNTTLGDANTDISTLRGIVRIADSSATNGILFGSGNANYDVNLYRSAPNVLKTDDAFEIAGGFSVLGDTTLGDTCSDTTTINGNLVINCTTEANGIRFSDGAGGTDTVLFRGGADILRTNDTFVAGTTLNVLGNTTLGDANNDQTTIRGIVRIADSSATNGILFGSGNANYDVNLYRSGVDNLVTDDNFTVRSNTTLGDATTDIATLRGIVRIADSSATNGILFGSGNANYDTNLYRSAANTLRTDDDVIIDGNLTIVGNITALGTYSRLDTLITGTSSMQITNNGSDTALTVRQTGPTDIATFYDDGAVVLHLKDGGNVGVGTLTPTARLDVSGTFKTTGTATIGTLANSVSDSIVTQVGGVLQRRTVNQQVWDTTAKFVSAFDGELTVNYLTKARNSNGINESIVFDDGTNVGVNTNVPTARLDVNGTTRVRTLNTSTGNSVICETGGVLERRTIDSRVWGSSIVDGTGTTNFVTKWLDADTITNSIIRDNGTQVGIGIAQVAGVVLNVGGTIQASRTDAASEGGQIQFSRSTDNASVYAIDVFGNTTTPNFRIIDTVANAARMEMSSTGNFGFGVVPNTTHRVRISGNITATGTATIGTLSNSTTLNTVVVADANGVLQRRSINPSAWDGVTGGIVGGTGTLNFVPKWNSTTTLSNSLTFDNGTQVGIATTAPTARLDVSGGSLGTTAGNTLEISRFTSSVSNASYLRFYNRRVIAGTDWNSASTRIQQRIDTSDMGYIEFNPSGGARGIGFGNNNAEYMRIIDGGNVGINTTTPTARLHVNGTFTAGAITSTTINTQNNNITMGTGTLTCNNIVSGPISCTTINTNNNSITAGTGNIAGAIITGSTLRSTGDVIAYFVSDSRLKENKIPLTNTLAKIEKINAYEFDWKKVDESVCSRSGHDVGLLAQEVQEILPEAIYERDNGYLSLDYIKMIPLLVSSIKELKAEIELLKAK